LIPSLRKIPGGTSDNTHVRKVLDVHGSRAARAAWAVSSDTHV